MADKPTLCNGQVWEQADFPCFSVMVLMLVAVDDVLQFCRVETGHCEVPLVMTEADGTWMYSAEDLLAVLDKYGYGLVGTGRIEIERTADG